MEQDSLKYTDLQEEETVQQYFREHRHRDSRRRFGRCGCDVGYYFGIVRILGANSESLAVFYAQGMGASSFPGRDYLICGYGMYLSYNGSLAL